MSLFEFYLGYPWSMRTAWC